MKLFLYALLLISVVAAKSVADTKRQIKAEATNESSRRLSSGVKPNPTRLGGGFEAFTDDRNKQIADGFSQNEIHSNSFLIDEDGERQLLRDRDQTQANQLVGRTGSLLPVLQSGVDQRGFGLRNQGLFPNLGGNQFLGTPVVYVPNLGYGYLTFPGIHQLQGGFGNRALGQGFQTGFGRTLPFGNTFGRGLRGNQFGFQQFPNNQGFFGGGQRIQPGLTVVDPGQQTFFDGTTKLSTTPVIIRGNNFRTRS